MESQRSQTPSAARRTLTIISPTKNEADNIEEFVKRTTLSLRDRDISWKIVFADDSDDDTPEVIARLASDGHPVRCHHRQPHERLHSIGGAVNAVLATVDTDFVAVIDADLQHPPELLPALVGPLVLDVADFVVGTRYAAGGSAEGLGSTWRQTASRSSALVTKMILPQFWKASDLASGVFAFRFGDLDMSRKYCTSCFKVMMEIMVRCHPERLAEVPYAFEDRTEGLSKARIRDGLTVVKSLLQLRLKSRQLLPRPVLSERHELAASGGGISPNNPAGNAN